MKPYEQVLWNRLMSAKLLIYSFQQVNISLVLAVSCLTANKFFRFTKPMYKMRLPMSRNTIDVSISHGIYSSPVNRIMLVLDTPMLLLDSVYLDL